MTDKSRYHKIDIRVDEDSFNLIEKLREETGLSAREILAYSSQTCVPCGQTTVPVFTKERRTVHIPVGILFKSMLTKHNQYETKKK